MVRLTRFADPLFPLHLLDDLARRPFAGGASGARVPLEVFAREDGLLVRALLPGIDPASLDVEVEDETLRVRAARPTEEPEGVRVLARELPTGPVDLVLRLPFRPAADGVSARYEAGVLTLELEKAVEERTRKIQVQTR